MSVLGIGGAKLKGMYRETAEIYTSAQDEYGHSIQGDFEAQADAAANLIKQAGYVDSLRRLLYRKSEDALAAWNDTDDPLRCSTRPTVGCTMRWIRCMRR